MRRTTKCGKCQRALDYTYDETPDPDGVQVGCPACKAMTCVMLASYWLKYRRNVSPPPSIKILSVEGVLKRGTESGVIVLESPPRPHRPGRRITMPNLRNRDDPDSDPVRFVRCPECNREQADMGRNVKCEECGYGPMPYRPPDDNEPALIPAPAAEARCAELEKERHQLIDNVIKRGDAFASAAADELHREACKALSVGGQETRCEWCGGTGRDYDGGRCEWCEEWVPKKEGSGGK